jgi:hypothetical protein
MAAVPASGHRFVEDTRRWLERAVIGLNLCPFAKAVHVHNQVHFALTEQTEFAAVLEDLGRELADLLEQPPSVRETTLLIVSGGFGEFLVFNELVRAGERLIARRGLEGVVQLASFHPAFIFAGTEEDDLTNLTNRSPHPTLHLLREASIERAVAAFPRAEDIYQANMRTVARLGHDGWRALGLDPS